MSESTGDWRGNAIVIRFRATTVGLIRLWSPEGSGSAFSYTKDPEALVAISAHVALRDDLLAGRDGEQLLLGHHCNSVLHFRSKTLHCHRLGGCTQEVRQRYRGKVVSRSLDYYLYRVIHKIRTPGIWKTMFIEKSIKTCLFRCFVCWMSGVFVVLEWMV